MKKFFLILCLIAMCVEARAQHDDHDHTGHTHNPADETPSALFEEMSAALAAQRGPRVRHSFSGVAPRFGLAVQRQLFAEAGVSLDFYRFSYIGASEYVSFDYSNLRPYLSGEVMVGNHFIGGGKLGVEYIRATPLLGMAFGADASYLTDGKANAVLVTPRLMLSFVTVEVFYGYNIFVRNHLTRWIGHHRVGVSMTLNPRFWKRKKQIYEDYYNTYVE
jgi:hypothetical protein